MDGSFPLFGVIPPQGEKLPFFPLSRLILPLPSRSTWWERWMLTISSLIFSLLGRAGSSTVAPRWDVSLQWCLQWHATQGTGLPWVQGHQDTERILQDSYAHKDKRTIRSLQGDNKALFPYPQVAHPHTGIWTGTRQWDKIRWYSNRQGIGNQETQESLSG